MTVVRKAIRAFRRNAAAWIVLVIALAFTGMGVAFERKAQSERERRLFDEEAAEAINRLERRIDTYGATLNGARGLMSVNPDLTRARPKQLAPQAT